jgi:hypothetical protein
MEVSTAKDACETVVKELEGSGTSLHLSKGKVKGKSLFHTATQKLKQSQLCYPCQILQLYLTINSWLHTGQKLSAGLLKTSTHSKSPVTMVFRV